MIFIILCILVVAVWVIGALWEETEGYGIGGGIVLGFFYAMSAAIIATFVFFICLFNIPANDKTEDGGTESLQALSTSSSIQGRSFFLSSGYVNGVRTLNFIVHQPDGGFRVEQADASDSLIYEGTSKPTVSATFHSYSNGWVLPWDIRQGTTYRFDVPQGSVLEGYTVDNAGGN